uniref:Uncharacterized protein n=1 Tax=Romanomermis culicivorax TaxID=13658 RepID=A0A915HHH0_ROMCU
MQDGDYETWDTKNNLRAKLILKKCSNVKKFFNEVREGGNIDSSKVEDIESRQQPTRLNFLGRRALPYSLNYRFSMGTLVCPKKGVDY